MKKYLLIGLFAVIFTPSANAVGLLSYKPPGGSSATQIHSTGGTRGLAAAAQVQILAPKETALTTKAQPILYWYQPSQIKLESVNVSLTKSGETEPVLKKSLPATAGLQRFLLSDYNTSLDAGIEYVWAISLIDNEGKETKKLSANLRYQEAAEPLATIEDQAQAGYWYDVLQALVDSKSPQTNELLKQVGILVPALF
jgi:hypothetical protein